MPLDPEAARETIERACLCKTCPKRHVCPISNVLLMLHMGRAVPARVILMDWLMDERAKRDRVGKS